MPSIRRGAMTNCLLLIPSTFPGGVVPEVPRVALDVVPCRLAPGWLVLCCSVLSDISLSSFSGSVKWLCVKERRERALNLGNRIARVSVFSRPGGPARAIRIRLDLAARRIGRRHAPIDRAELIAPVEPVVPIA